MRAAPSERLTDLLDAACAAICERGAEAVRMQAIADRAGVSRTLLHYHFSSRRDLLHQAFEHADLEVDRYVEARLETCGTPRERLDCVLGSYLDDEPAVRTNWGVWLELRWMMWASPASSSMRRMTSHSPTSSASRDSCVIAAMSPSRHLPFVVTAGVNHSPSPLLH